MPSNKWSAVLMLSVATAAAAAVFPEHPNGAIHNRERWVDLDPLYTGGALKPMPPVTDSWQDPSAEIFVTIPNYRDDKCGDTLKELFSKAAHPDRVYVGVIQQRTGEDVDCVARYCALVGHKGADLTGCPRVGQIRHMLMSVQEARGNVIVYASRMDSI